MLTADVNRLGYIGRKPGAVSSDRDADSWYTPASYIEAARAVMDGIDLDPFSSEKANSTIRATRILTEDRSAFSTSWRPNKHKYPNGVRVWMNPPYSSGLISRAVDTFLENLSAGHNVKGMVKNHCLAGAIADVGMGELRRQIEYKAAWNGRNVVVVDRWFPSSKTCSDCGSYQAKMPLSVRQWTCPDCGARHDRDINAAINILKFSTAGEAGLQARGAGQNVLGHVSSTCDEARTDAEKFTEADYLEQVA